MRCLYCHQKAGLMKRICPVCAKVIGVVERCAGHVGWTELVDAFANEGLTRAQVDRVLDAEINGEPAWRDRLTSEMSNVLMRGLGMPGRQTPQDVQRVRRAVSGGGGEGSWSACDSTTEVDAELKGDVDGR